MGKKARKKSNVQDTTVENPTKIDGFRSKILKNELVVGILIGLVPTLILALFSMAVKWGALTESIENMSADIQALESTLATDVSAVSKDVATLSKAVNDLNTNVAMLNIKVFDYRPTSKLSSAIATTYSAIDAPCTKSATHLSATSSVVYSKSKPDRIYTVEQVANQPLLLPSVDGNQETFFYGQLDTAGNWDGHCIVNTYEHDKLLLITDAQYDRGNLLSCKQVFPDTSKDGQDVWVVSERKIEDGFSSGETWRYVRTDDCIKSFGFDDVEVNDITDADEFRSNIGTSLEGYYCGNNSDGMYNDDTGNAYFVKYFEDGTVYTLYVGKFKDGQFNDCSGNAWMVGKLSMGAPYSYYCGPFENGNARKDAKFWQEPLTVAQVREIVKEEDFKCSLKWSSSNA